jgi:hypothetical protein
MAISGKFDIISDASIQATSNGFRQVRKCAVFGMSSNNALERIPEALEWLLTTYPIHSYHPIDRYGTGGYGMILTEVVVQQTLSYEVVTFLMTYETTSEPKLGGKWVRSARMDPNWENYGLNIKGDRIQVKWKRKGADWTDPGVVFHSTRGALAPRVSPVTIYKYIRHFDHATSTNNVLKIWSWPAKWRRIVNRQFEDPGNFFQFYPGYGQPVGSTMVLANTVLVWDLQVYSRDKGYTLWCEMELRFDPRGWNPFVYAKNELGDTPADVGYYSANGNDIRKPDHAYYDEGTGNVIGDEEGVYWLPGNTTDANTVYAVKRPVMYMSGSLHGTLETGGLDILQFETGEIYGNP